MYMISVSFENGITGQHASSSDQHSDVRLWPLWEGLGHLQHMPLRQSAREKIVTERELTRSDTFRRS